MALTTLSLFGGDKPWSPLDWTNSDDTVRGGSSTSELKCTPFEPIAVFKGNLDTKTLGGAGFASQRTTGEDREWDLKNYDGIVLDIEKSDKMRYTLTLKDELLPKNPNGREQSTISWEYDFKVAEGGEKVYITWDAFRATYRGKEKKDTKPLDLQHVKRFSLLMRSFFATQEGDFSLSIKSISAYRKASSAGNSPYHDEPNEPRRNQDAETRAMNGQSGQEQGWFGWLFRICNMN